MAGIGVAAALAVSTAAVLLNGGCAARVDYYAQAASGHLALMQQARPVSAWLASPDTDAQLRARLQLSQRIRNWSVTDLGLPENSSYRAYADLKRPAAIWNVVATPELSLTLRTWCMPVLGCMGYRGFFDQREAVALAAELKAAGEEVDVYGVPAYSSLGYTNWLGGDPLLNTFIHWPEGELARLIFHELAHQVVYISDDTTFNESFATAVERIGARRWLDQQATPEVRAEYEAFEARRRDFRALIQVTREALEAVYADPSLDAAAKRHAKAARMAEMRADYARMKAERWGGYAGYDPWFARANNATLAVQAAYDDLASAFEALFEREGRDFGRFYAEVRRIAALPKPQRLATLQSIN